MLDLYQQPTVWGLVFIRNEQQRAVVSIAVQLKAANGPWMLIAHVHMAGITASCSLAPTWMRHSWLMTWSAIWCRPQVHATVKLLKTYHQRLRDLANGRRIALARCGYALQNMVSCHLERAILHDMLHGLAVCTASAAFRRGSSVTAVLSTRLWYMKVMIRRKRRMQALSGLGTADAHEETIVMTLRLKEMANEEGRIQAATFMRLLFETWEPQQAVSQPCCGWHSVGDKGRSGPGPGCCYAFRSCCTEIVLAFLGLLLAAVRTVDDSCQMTADRATKQCCVRGWHFTGVQCMTGWLPDMAACAHSRRGPCARRTRTTWPRRTWRSWSPLTPVTQSIWWAASRSGDVPAVGQFNSIGFPQYANHSSDRWMVCTIMPRGADCWGSICWSNPASPSAGAHSNLLRRLSRCVVSTNSNLRCWIASALHAVHLLDCASAGHRRHRRHEPRGRVRGPGDRDRRQIRPGVALRDDEPLRVRGHDQAHLHLLFRSVAGAVSARDDAPAAGVIPAQWAALV